MKLDDTTITGLAHTPSPDEPGARLATHVSRLDLTNFRSYPALRLDVGPQPVLLTGINGVGKTNLLEALSFLAPGRGLRRAALPDIARLHDGTAAASWAVAARIDGRDGSVSLGTGMEANPNGGPARRAVRIDGEPARGQATFAERVSMIWLTPDMDRLFMEGGSARRRFLDRMVYGFDPEHARRIAVYEQAMRGRQKLLRDGSGDGAWLASEEETMATNGIAIAAARREVVLRLDTAIAAEDGLADRPFPRAALALEGEVEDWLAEGPALEAEDRLRDVLAAARSRDADAGRALRGPHRSDLAVRHRDKDMAAALCSTGEQKALLIAIILAHARLLGLARGAAPILLLDEVAAHLDQERRAALAERILSLGAQAWLTGTDRRLFEAFGENAQSFDVSAGAVSPATGDSP
ncbi:MAG: DNA replication/repair protein RecF [Alphaproteobacteria bacterium]|nr:DNA replication/repair protein RecF [Alphaproteobacteria bacterium]